MAGEKIKLQEGVISKILVADTASELGAEAMLKTSLRKNKNNDDDGSSDDDKPQQKLP